MCDAYQRLQIVVAPRQMLHTQQLQLQRREPFQQCQRRADERFQSSLAPFRDGNETVEWR